MNLGLHNLGCMRKEFNVSLPLVTICSLNWAFFCLFDVKDLLLVLIKREKGIFFQMFLSLVDVLVLIEVDLFTLTL